MSDPFLEDLWERIVEVGGTLGARSGGLSLIAEQWGMEVETLALTLDNGIGKGYFKIVAVTDPVLADD